MTQNKIFEVRDRATMIPVLVTKIYAGVDAMTPMGNVTEHRLQAERLISHAGFGPQPLYLYQPLVGAGLGTVSYDSTSWPTFRTHKVAHAYIEKHWGELEDGAVICVEFIEAERDTPKTTDLTPY